MIINHNMNALNAHRNMGINIGNSGKSMEKLSSGLRINRAGDDAAGLAISEKMRGQIRGLDQASRNAQDGISLIQTAEGALNETHAILQRMRELAVQAANDTNLTDDRAQLQQEINQLTSEVNRISNTTEFNQQKVLAGQGDKNFTAKLQIGANKGQSLTINISKVDTKALDISTDTQKEVTMTGATNAANINVADGEKLTVTIDGTATDIVTGAATTGTDVTKEEIVEKVNAAIKAAGKEAELKINADGKYEITGKDAEEITDLKNEGTDLTGTLTKAEKELNGITNGMNDDVIGSALDISSHESAAAAVEKFNSAINNVSTERSKLGSFQNRLEHTINNLNTSSENLTAAESRIRDVDMAKEMMTFSKNNILQQAAQAMLAQANQQPQGVLQLLR
ncbi:flagellin N-terminal helical domain-containing protein [Clostridium sp. Marseille-Q7071]